MQLRRMPVDKLKHHPQNPRKHGEKNIDAIIASYKEHGELAPVIIWGKQNYVIAGNGRLEAAKRMNKKHIGVLRADHLTKEQVLSYMIADNKTTDMSAFDDDALIGIISGLSDSATSATGFQDYELQPLLTTFNNAASKDDVVSEIPDNPASEPGKVYTLGDHKLICGDCLDPRTVNKVLSAKTVDMLCTDPPYGVAYANKNAFLNARDKGNHVQIKIQNDDIKDYYALFEDFLSVIPFSTYNTVYIFMSNFALHNLRIGAEKAGITWGDYLVWVKNNFVLGRKDYKAQHEFIYYGWKKRHKFYGASGSKTVLEFDKPHQSKLHPTMKPVKLLEKLIIDGSRRGMLVFDPFVGSGSTLIACEKTNRIFAGIELDPAYCDVTRKRWAEFVHGDGCDWKTITKPKPKRRRKCHS